MELKITAKKRNDLKKKNKIVKKSGLILGVLFGGSLKESLPVSLDRKEINTIVNEAEYHRIVTVKVGEQEYKTIIREIQWANITHKITHISFWVIDGVKEISTLVPINLTGTSEAVSTSIGILVTPITSVKIRCAPKYLPESLPVPIDSLSNIGDKITIGKIELPENVFLAHGVDPKQQIVSIAPFQKMIEISKIEEESASDEEDSTEESTSDTTEGEEKESEK